MKKNILLLFILVSAFAFFILHGCKNDKGEVPPPPVTHCDSLDVSYNLDVKPIVTANCAIPGCHVVGGGGTGDFTSYTSVSGFAQSISVRIQLPTTHFQHMPQGGVLSAEELDIFLCWIEDGAQNN